MAPPPTPRSPPEPSSTPRTRRGPAYAAAALAWASAAVSLYWTLGGTRLLDTVGGAVEDLARERSAPAVALGAVTVLLKAGTGLLAVALAREHGGRWRRWVVRAGAAAGGVLVAWGGANVVVGGLVLSGVVAASSSVDEHALRWHVYLWDMWFLVWGALLTVAVARHRRRR